MTLAKINITESPQQLFDLSSQQTHKLGYQKAKALYLLKSGQASSVEQAAETLECRVETIKKWLKIYNQEGVKELLKSSSLSPNIEVPIWAIERLCQELQMVQFFPENKTLRAWLLAIGIKIGFDKTAEVRSRMKIYLESLKLHSSNESLQDAANSSSNQLLIEPDIYAQYERWKEEHKLSSDRDALDRLITEFFESEIFQPSDSLSNDTESEVVANDLLQVLTRDSEVPTLLNQSDLAKRLGVTSSVLKNNRSNRTFTGWSKQQDPNEISWQWNPNLRKYQSLPIPAD